MTIVLFNKFKDLIQERDSARLSSSFRYDLLNSVHEKFGCIRCFV